MTTCGHDELHLVAVDSRVYECSGCDALFLAWRAEDAPSRPASRHYGRRTGVTKGPFGGYGRYSDDPESVGCPRAKTWMTPCAARHGANACDDDGSCVGCGEHPADLLTALVAEVTPRPTTEGEHR